MAVHRALWGALRNQDTGMSVRDKVSVCGVHAGVNVGKQQAHAFTLSLSWSTTTIA